MTLKITTKINNDLLRRLRKIYKKKIVIEVVFKSGTKSKELLNIIASKNKIRWDRNPWFASGKRQVEFLTRNMSYERMKGMTSKAFIKAFGEGIVKDIQGNIDKMNYKGSHVPLTDKYVKQKVKKFGSKNPILVATGDLRNSITFKSKVKE